MKTKKSSKDVDGCHISRTPTPSMLGKRDRQPRKIFSPSSYDDRRPVKEEPISPETSRSSSVNRQPLSNAIDQRGASSSKETVKTTIKPSNQTQSKERKNDDDIEISTVKPGRSRPLDVGEKSTPAVNSPQIEVETASNIPEEIIDKHIELVRESSPEIFTPSLAERVKRHSAAKANANMPKVMERPRPKKKSGAKKKGKAPKKGPPSSSAGSITSKVQDTAKASIKLPKASVCLDSPSGSHQTKKPSVNNDETKGKLNGKTASATTNTIVGSSAGSEVSKTSKIAGSVIAVYKESQVPKNGQAGEDSKNQQIKAIKTVPTLKIPFKKSAAVSTSTPAGEKLESLPEAQNVVKTIAKEDHVEEETSETVKLSETDNPETHAFPNATTQTQMEEAVSKTTILPKKTEAFIPTSSRTVDIAIPSHIKASRRTDANGKNLVNTEDTSIAASSNGSRTHDTNLPKNTKRVSDTVQERVPINDLSGNEELEEDHPSLKFTISLKGTPSIHATTEKRCSELLPKKSVLAQDDGEGMEAIGLEEEYNEVVRVKKSGRVRGKDGRWESKAKERPKILPTFTKPSTLRISSPLKKAAPPVRSSIPESIVIQKEGSTDSSQCSASPELGGSGLGFTYAKPKFDYDIDEKEESSDDDTPVVRTLRPRKKTTDRANSSESVESSRETDSVMEPPKPQILPPYVERPRLPTPPPQVWFTGVVERMPAFLDSSELPFDIEKKKCEDAARLAIRAALLDKAGQPCRSESPKSNMGKWIRPSIDDDGHFQAKDFLPVQAELPKLLPKQLAILEDDRDVPMWPTPPENFDLYEDEVADYLRMSKNKRVRIDEALRFLHGSCGHNVMQACQTLKGEKEELLKIPYPPPMDSDDEEIFCLLYMGYGKHFEKYVKRFPDYTMTDIVEYYYDTKKQFNYKTLVQNNLPEERDLEELRRDVKNFYSGNCHLCKKQDKYLINKDGWYVCRTCRYYQNELAELPLKSKDEFAPFPQYHQYLDNPTDLNLNEFHGVEDFHQDSLVRDLKKPTKEEIETMVYEEQERLRKMGIATNPSNAGYSQLGKEFYERLSPFYRENVPSSIEEEIEVLVDKLIPLKKSGRKIVLRDVLKNLHKEPIKALVIPKKLRPPKEKTTEDFTEKDYYFAMQAFIRYGLNFELVAEVVGNKTPAAMEAFYNQSKANIDKVLGKSNPNSVKKTAAYAKMLSKKNPQLKSIISHKYEVKL